MSTPRLGTLCLSFFNLYAPKCLIRLASQLILVRRAHNVEVKINVRPVETREAVEHDDLSARLGSLRKEVLLESLFLLYRGEELGVVVIRQDTVAIVVQYCNPLHRVQRGRL